MHIRPTPAAEDAYNTESDYVYSRSAVVEHPRFQDPKYDHEASFSYYIPDMPNLVRKIVEHKHGTPETHPKVLDMAAGDGSMAAILVDMEWKASDVTCMDLGIPNHPFPQLKGAEWVYVDLRRLAHQIERGVAVDPRITALKNQFDIVACSCSFFDRETINLLCDYFAKKDTGIKLGLGYL